MDLKTDPYVLQCVEHQLCVRGAAAARADLPLREAPLQDRYPPPGHRLHRAPQVGGIFIGISLENSKMVQR